MKHNLLIIEDDKIMRVTLTDYLRSKDHEVVACPLGADGITAFHKEEFSLVISDVMLPDMNGLDILQKIKERKKTPTEDEEYIRWVPKLGSTKDFWVVSAIN